MKVLWIEEYAQCGCSTEAKRKRDLLGYCAKHGTQRSNLIKIPIGIAAKKFYEMMDKKERPKGAKAK